VPPSLRRLRRLETARDGALTTVAGALVVTALLAIAILLFGELGRTEGHILATTFLLAAFGLLAVPGAILIDQRRASALALASLGLCATGFALGTATTWAGEPPDALDKLTGTVVTFALAAGQTAALTARRRDADPPAVRMLATAATVAAAVLAGTAATAIWLEPDAELVARLFAAGLVLDVLLVALVPVTALRHAQGADRRAIAPAGNDARTSDLVCLVDEISTRVARNLAAASTELNVLGARIGELRASVAEQRIALDELRAGLPAAGRSSPTEGGTMTVAELVRLLAEANVAYELLPHARTLRAADEAALLHLRPEEVAKTVVLVTPDDRVRAVIPASERLDLAKARAALRDGDAIELASERRLAIDYPMFELGAVPPLGGPPGDRVLVDRRLAERDSVVFEAGSHDESIRLAVPDLLRMTSADVVDVCDAH
jgi:Ala-tRNA(Pro) deacylase